MVKAMAAFLLFLYAKVQRQRQIKCEIFHNGVEKMKRSCVNYANFHIFCRLFTKKE